MVVKAMDPRRLTPLLESKKTPPGQDWERERYRPITIPGTGTGMDKDKGGVNNQPNRDMT